MSKRVENPYKDGHGPKSLSPAEKIARSTVRSESGCLLWTGSVDKDGYGKAWYERRSIRAHQLAWIAEHGALPVKPLQVLHHCDVSACCESSHLYAGTQARNMLDRLERGRWKGGRPKKGAGDE